MNIPASQLVSVIPGVLGAGGNPLSLNSVFITDDTAVPIGAVTPFSTLDDVEDFFGPTSREAELAQIYFSGFDNATRIPGTLYFATYNATAVAAYLRGGSMAGVTLAELQALNGTVIVVIDGVTVTSAAINLAGASSFSNAAVLIQTGIQTTGNVFNGTGTIDDGAGSAGTVLTIDSVVSGSVHVGDFIVVAGGAATEVLVQVSGTPGGVGVYTVADAQDSGVSAAATVTILPTVAYDSQRAAFRITSPTTGADSTIAYATGTIAADLKLQAAQAAVLSQGADAATPAGIMNGVTEVTQNWALFMTTFEPIDATKLLFADWVQGTESRYAYVAWDSNELATVADQPTTFGAIVNAAEDDGVIPVYDATGDIAAFICGVAASIDFLQPNGRITFAFKGQAGLEANVTDATIADNLIGNGYNFYGSYATANETFTFLQPGQISGSWLWIDPYVNQIYLNSQLQLAFMTLLAGVNSVPYNTTGYTLLRSAAMDPINAALSFGSIQPGIALSASQAAQVNTAAGFKISDTLSNLGWYLQIVPADALTRAARESPPMTLWYTDGGSVQKIELASIDVQ
jgi:hypothetical protein